MTDVINGVPRELLQGLVDLWELKGRGRPGSPNHCHEIPGVWDQGNPKGVAGKPCAECAIYDAARALLATAQPADHSEHDLNMVSQPAADGEREAEAQLQEWARDKFTFSGRYKGSVYGNTDWAIARAIHADLFKRHQPQQAVAVTDEVRRLREALEFYANGDHLLLADPDAWDTCSGEPMNWLHDEAGTASVEDGSVAKAALAAHKTGEEDNAN